ncbi:MAG TPA: hypothetical protein PK129_11075 [Cellvibrionaceae bacterium]|nr:hypothetical protein [Cellvibrionaceae bacterium]
MAYYLVFHLAVKGFKIYEADPTVFPLVWTLIKLVIGIPFGVVIVFIYSSLETSGVERHLSYIFSFGGVRLIEWLLVYKLFSMRHALHQPKFLFPWIGICIVVSMLSDIPWIYEFIELPKFIC